MKTGSSAILSAHIAASGGSCWRTARRRWRDALTVPGGEGRQMWPRRRLHFHGAIAAFSGLIDGVHT